MMFNHMRYSEFLDFHIHHHAEAKWYELKGRTLLVNILLDIISLEEQPIDKVILMQEFMC